MATITEMNRMAGLISGLDTKSLVEAMTMNTKNRLDTRKQKLQTMQWKQEGYRDIISKLTDFKNKFLKLESNASLKAYSVMSKYASTSSNDKVKVSANSSAQEANYTISKATSAKSAKIASGGAVAGASIALDFSGIEAGKNYTVKMTLDGVTKDVTFKGDDGQEGFLSALNRTFSGAVPAGDGNGFKLENGRLSFGIGDGHVHTFSMGYNQAFGLVNDAHSRISLDSTLGSVDFMTGLDGGDANGNYNLEINGVSFSFNKNTSVSSMMNTINESKAGVKMTFDTLAQSFALETKETGAGVDLSVTQSTGNLLNALFNADAIPEGNATASDKITFNAYDDLAAKDKALTYAMNWDHKKDLNEYEGEDFNISFSVQNPDGSDSGTFDVSVNIKDVIEGLGDVSDLSKSEYQTQLREAINSELEAQTSGSGLSSISADKAGGFSIKTDDKLVTITDGGSTAFSEAISAGETVNNLKVNVADGNYVVGQGEMTFSVGGETVTVQGKTIYQTDADGEIIKDDEGNPVFDSYGDITINDLVKSGLFKMNNGVLMANKDFSAADAGASEFMTDTFGGTSAVGGGSIDTTSDLVSQGANASITIRTEGGEDVTYSGASSIFTFNGTTINISDLKDFDATNGVDEEINIETKRDSSGIKDVLVKFADDYNKLIDELYGLLNTARPKSSGEYYDPLTDDQKAEMKQDEIDKWNESAKIGLFYNDSNIARLVSDIRSSLSFNIDGFGLFDMGLNVSTKGGDNGKIIVDESKLDACIENNPDKIATFFTDPGNGLAYRLEKAIDSAISGTGANQRSYGYLVALAGRKGDLSDTRNTLYYQMQSLQKTVDTLNTRYQKEQNKYWAQFTRLEKLMANMQSQSSMFSTQ